MKRRHVIALAGLFIAGCAPASKDLGKDLGKQLGLPAPLDPRGDRSDAVVATVNGHPLFATAVVAQARAKGSSLHEALEELVNFEVLAEAALAAGKLDNEVQEATKAALVRQLLAARFPTSRLTPAAPAAPGALEESRLDSERADFLRYCDELIHQHTVVVYRERLNRRGEHGLP